MHKKAVKYKDCWLDPNSRAYELLRDKKLKELDRHMKEVDEKDRALRGETNASNGMGHYSSPPPMPPFI